MITNLHLIILTLTEFKFFSLWCSSVSITSCKRSSATIHVVTPSHKGFFVVDIDECAVANGGCAEKCVNFPGSYQCKCRKGYTVQADNSCTGGYPSFV